VLPCGPGKTTNAQEKEIQRCQTFCIVQARHKKKKNEIQRREKRKYVEMPGTSDCVDRAGGGRFA